MADDTPKTAAKPVAAPSPVAAATPAVAPATPVAAETATAPAAKAPETKPAVAAKPETAAAPQPVAAKAAPAKPNTIKPATTKPAAKVKAAPAPKPKKQIKKAPPAAVPAVTSMKEAKMDTNTIKTVTDKAQAQAKTMFADANDRSKVAMEKGTKTFEEMNAFTKGNIEAVVESTKIYAKGLEAMGQDAAAYAKKSYEDATAVFKSMASVKSPTDFFKLQSDYARTAFDAMIAETSKSTEKMVKLVGEAAKPISNRVSLAVEKVKIAA